MPAPMDETQLTAAACRGSLEAFETLVVHYEPKIRRMLYSLTRDQHQTQGLCQETLLAAYRALPRMGVDLRLAPWLYRIALNQARSEWRRRKYVTVVPFCSPLGSETTDPADWGDYALASAEQFEERVEQRELIQRVLSQLPQSAVACLLLDA